MGNDTDKKSWKERLKAIPPQKTIAAVVREINALGIKISDKGLRKQNDKHGILAYSDGLVSIRVDTVLSLNLWKTKDGTPVIDLKKSQENSVELYNKYRAKKTKHEASIKEREDLVAAGELIHKDKLNKLVLAPAIVLQQNVMSSVDKQAEVIIDMVGGDHGKGAAVARDLRLWIKGQLAQAYADTVYQLSIDPVRLPQQTSLIND